MMMISLLFFSFVGIKSWKQINDGDDKKIPMSCQQQEQQQLLVLFLFGNFLGVFMFRLFTLSFPSVFRKKLDYFLHTIRILTFSPLFMLKTPDFVAGEERWEGMKSSPGNTHSNHIRLIKA
jgi:hypothetical protein